MPPFSEIYQKYFDFVWFAARRLGVSVEEVDDVVQDIFLVIHSRLDTLRQPDALRSWIYSIVRRTVSSYRRSKRVRKVAGANIDLIEDFHGTMPRTPLDLVQAADETKLLWNLLSRLDEPKRELFALVEIEQMSVLEAAEALKIPANTAYSRLRVARIEFEQALERHGNEQEVAARCKS